MILSASGFTLTVDRAFEAFWGIPTKEDVAYNVGLYRDPQLRQTGFIPIFERAFGGEQVTGPPTFYDAGHAHGGKARWLRHVITPLLRADGRVREVIVVHVPLANEEQLEAARRLETLGVFVSGEDARTRPLNPLSPRERSVLLLIAEGCSNAEIAEALAISANTVKFSRDLALQQARRQKPRPGCNRRCGKRLLLALPIQVVAAAAGLAPTRSGVVPIVSNPHTETDKREGG